ncbi:SRPBCC family protein, partial [Arthrobacter sp. H5]|uniref:SRPBCC family protein n=1 Tax=Arthrobacter sp. H5 TaxID=1267973 RepID=UPI0015660BC3
MATYDVTDSAVISAPPDRVWEALASELDGAAQWWVPHNTFLPGTVSPEQVGGSVDVTVHPRGVEGGGPKLRFSCVTRESVPGSRLVQEYVSGAFRGTGWFTMEALDD